MLSGVPGLHGMEVRLSDTRIPLALSGRCVSSNRQQPTEHDASSR